MTYKIALCGAHGTGKTLIINELKFRLQRSSYSVVVIESPSRYVKSLGFNLNRGGDWRTQLFSVVHRETRQLEALQSKPDFILADRFVLDEMAYTAYHQKYRETPVDPEVSSLFSDYLDTVQAISAEFLDQDLDQFWDKAYFKPAHPDYPPEADGDRESAVDFQKDIESRFVDLIDYFNLKSRIGTLDEDLYVAADQIWNDPDFEDERDKAWH